jgi:alpha-tubulin suppressor-like RCC1 family protein
MGGHHSVFLTNTMEAYVMGENKQGQLGLGTHEINKSTYPTLV